MRKKRILRAKRSILFFLATAVLITVLAFGRKETIHSENSREDRSREYYSCMEEEYLEYVRGVLCEEGYSNCGLMLTFSRDAEEARSYRLTVHHRRLEYLDESGRERLIEKLAGKSREQRPEGFSGWEDFPVTVTFLDMAEKSAG